ncbi:hypothetical protein DB30_03359 [Enhygromyxa salina]|uniref:Uncharacterized protein n=1 Tax=Enhygromyxa salina TaxID=215803 RepID=A0A0C2CP89_9BACT|nr:hypothetical protein DB30_03359 [Enhygromyxa salina]
MQAEFGKIDGQSRKAKFVVSTRLRRSYRRPRHVIDALDPLDHLHRKRQLRRPWFPGSPEEIRRL